MVNPEYYDGTRMLTWQCLIQDMSRIRISVKLESIAERLCSHLKKNEWLIFRRTYWLKYWNYKRVWRCWNCRWTVGWAAQVCLVNESLLTHLRHDELCHAYTHTRREQLRVTNRCLPGSWQRLRAAKQML